MTTNDELGYLSERFNSMTDGLQQGERLRELFGLYVSSKEAKAAVETGVSFPVTAEIDNLTLGNFRL
jgi:hypothetical protein